MNDEEFKKRLQRAIDAIPSQPPLNHKIRPVLWYGADVDEVYSPEDYEQFLADGVADGLVPLYAEPPKREWVGLTGDEFLKLAQTAERGNYLTALRRMEAKLKEKNSV